LRERTPAAETAHDEIRLDAIVRQAAEAHGGYARTENAPGGGALLRVHFGAPLVQGIEAPVDQ
jgi:hypothetical protein